MLSQCTKNRRRQATYGQPGGAVASLAHVRSTFPMDSDDSSMASSSSCEEMDYKGLHAFPS